MHLLKYLDDLVVWAPAKVNLFLEVTGKRSDGYHEIATLIVAVRLYDTLIFRRESAGEITLQCTQPRLATGPDNLVIRAARLLQERTRCPYGARVRLIKRIPIEAGLAGGSTDAAATLVGLNSLWNLGLSRNELSTMSAELGSDIAFFFHAPAAWCTGRGEIVTPVSISRPLDIVLLSPAFGMPTAAVYKNVVVPLSPVSGEPMCRALEQGDVAQIGKLLHNRLQPAAEKLDARIAQYHQVLTELGTAGHQMSGSGSTVFAVCQSVQEAGRVAQALQANTQLQDCTVRVTRTLT